MFTFPPNTENIYLLQGEYSYKLVILSIIIACGASYTALFMNNRMHESGFFHKNFWLIFASIAMGLGIWSMHFIGMSAYLLPVPMEFDLFLTVVSIMPAILASYLAFYFTNKVNTSHWTYILAGLMMGLGIASMHYIGMAAMVMEAKFVYKPWIFLASTGIAVFVSYAALYTFKTLQRYMGNIYIKMGTSIILGVAISSMHYTGMSAVTFYLETPVQNGHMHTMDNSTLYVVTIGIIGLFVITGIASLLERYVDYRLNYFDSVTQFPNERQFEKDIGSLKMNSLAILHIDNLKNWIDAYGYSFVAKIIMEVANQLRKLDIPTVKIYRIEGNRFAILSMEEDEENFKSKVDRLMQELKEPMNIGDYNIVVEMVCTLSNSQEKGSDLFANCMAVLQHPSIQYNHQIVEYNPKVHTYSFERQILQDIERAMAENELFLVYQPKINPKTMECTGVEALLRWNHPIHGFISPGVFIPILERNEKSFSVTDWVIKTVCAQISLWVESGVLFKQVSINIPGPYVTSTRLCKTINEQMKAHNIDSKYLELEITETSVVHNIKNAIASVENFKEMGLSVALDDFGTGLSSLSYLKKLPISTIKIDKSFVDGIPQSKKDSAILIAIAQLSKSLNLKIVIEGVETKEQVDFINEMDEQANIQGYYFSRPLMAEDLVSYLEKLKRA